jgi:hypothetical protein
MLTMRQRIWRHLIAAAGVFVLAGAAAAQQPGGAAPITLPQVPVPTQPGAVVPQEVPPGSAGVPAAPGVGGVAVPGNGGTASRGFVMSGNGGYFCTSCPSAQPCNNGCGSLRSDAGFVFGSCRSYFNPCGPGLAGCGGHGHGHGHGGGSGCGSGLFGHDRCPGTPVYGTGPRVGFNPCIYDSYLNH